ncbi:MAG: MotA/TolQ/ExbB proton channel family protein [Pirellulales bacterium]
MLPGPLRSIDGPFAERARRFVRAWCFEPRGALRMLALLLAFLPGQVRAADLASEDSVDEPAVRIPAAALIDGSSAAVAAARIPTKSLLEMVLAGGPLLLPIIACSVVLLVVVFERTVSLRRRRVLPAPFIKRFLHQVQEGQLDRQQAIEECEANTSHIGKVFGAAVRKWGRPAVEVEQAIIDEGERVANDMRRYLRVMNGVATVSPLMGLLGTVWGMMAAFNAIASAAAMGKPELLAAGISQALLTTAAGLFVAIPALIVYLFFAGRVDRLIMDIDAHGQELVNLISAETSNTIRLTKKPTLKRAA